MPTSHDIMASEDDVPDGITSGKASKDTVPIYNGKPSTFPEFRIAAKGYFNRKGWSNLVLKGTSDTEVKSTAPLYYVCRNDDTEVEETLWTAREIITAIDKGEIEPTHYVVAPLGAELLMCAVPVG